MSDKETMVIFILIKESLIATFAGAVKNPSIKKLKQLLIRRAMS